jgi:protoheme IX farnesyltransferase
VTALESPPMVANPGAVSPGISAAVDAPTTLQRAAETGTVHADGAAAGSADTGSANAGLMNTLRAYVALTKPRIIELLIVTTIPVMFLAAHGVPKLGLVAAVTVGGYLSAGSANALNCWVDRDIDAEMRRTRRRPLPRNTVTSTQTVVFGLILGVVSTLWFGLLVNWLSSLLALTANVFYVVVYSMILKRRTSQNIVWGGAAGCFPTVIGWTAVTDHVGWAPLVLFMVVFLWTPPHFWALALRYKEDYAAANVPMLPCVATERHVTWQMMLYTWATVGCSLLLWPVAHTGPVYPIGAAVLGAGFLIEAHRIHGAARRGVEGVALKPMRMFHFSNTYLALLFVCAAIDPLVR